MKNQVTQNQILGLFLGSGHQLWVVMIKVFAGPSSRLISRDLSGLSCGTDGHINTWEMK